MPAQVNILNDISTMLRIPAKVSNELVDKSCLCIGSAILAAKRRGETQTAINIGIGSLSINLLDMQCKFIPGKVLKTAIKSALTADTDPVEVALEKAFAEKLLAVCEEVL
jgi:hypothetical protein